MFKKIQESFYEIVIPKIFNYKSIRSSTLAGPITFFPPIFTF